MRSATSSRPRGSASGDTVESGTNADIRVGNALPLGNMPAGTVVHNIELTPGRGAQLARSAGVGVQLLAKDGDYVTLRLPSGEMRMVRAECRATVGTVGNSEHQNVKIGKAGRKRHLGRASADPRHSDEPGRPPSRWRRGFNDSRPSPRDALGRADPWVPAPARRARPPTSTSSEAVSEVRSVESFE